MARNSTDVNMKERTNPHRSGTSSSPTAGNSTSATGAAGNNGTSNNNSAAIAAIPLPPPRPPVMHINQQEGIRRRDDEGGYYKDYVSAEGRRNYHRSTLDCEECDTQIDRAEALYHWSGVGPICYECSEDPESEYYGYKFEPRFY